MVTGEDVLNELCSFLEENIEAAVNEVNRKHNDGIIIQVPSIYKCKIMVPIRPCFVLEVKQAKRTEKQRIIESLVFTVEVRMMIQEHGGNEDFAVSSRYVEAVQGIIAGENVVWNYIAVEGWDSKSMVLVIEI